MNDTNLLATRQSVADCLRLETTIPDELKLLRRWVVWRMERRGGKRTKVPYAGSFRFGAKSNDPATWASFAVACRALKLGASHGELRHDAGGLGFQFGDDERIFCIDLDGCRDPRTGAIEPWAAEIVARFATFTEVSPSGRGVHIIGLGRKPGPRCRKGPLEIYGKGRFLAMTGRLLAGRPAELRDCQAELDQLYLETFGDPVDPNTAACVPPAVPCPLGEKTLLEKIAKAANGEKFSRLWAGDMSDHRGDHSAADLSLCRILAFWIGPDVARIEKLFRASGLYRSKWDRADYRDRTIKLAISGCTSFVDWGKPAKRSGDSSQSCTCQGDKCSCPSFSTGVNTPHRETGTTQPSLTRDSADAPDPANLLASGIVRPELPDSHSPCRRMKVALHAVSDPERHRVSGFACWARDCTHCWPVLRSLLSAWYWGIIRQFKPIFMATTTGKKEAAAIRKQISRAGGLYIRLPLANGQALWFTNVATPTTREVSQEEAWKAFNYALDDLANLPSSERISASRVIAFSRKSDRDEPTEQWRRVPEAGNLTDVDWEAFITEAKATDPKYVYSENWERDRCDLTMRCSRAAFYAFLERANPGYERPMPAVRIKIRPRSLVLCPQRE
jgi:putative DNA primase/helicase